MMDVQKYCRLQDYVDDRGKRESHAFLARQPLCQPASIDSRRFRIRP
jgi:hypothetical protein